VTVPARHNTSISEGSQTLRTADVARIVQASKDENAKNRSTNFHHNRRPSASKSRKQTAIRLMGCLSSILGHPPDDRAIARMLALNVAFIRRIRIEIRS
jgi:hypothetical protein